MKKVTVDLSELLSPIANIDVIREESTNAQVVIASSTKKKVRITWAQSVHEIFFDFVLEQGEYHSDWVDFYDGETIEDIEVYVVEVVKRFFERDTRIRASGHPTSVSNVEYAINAEWRPLLVA